MQENKDKQFIQLYKIIIYFIINSQFFYFIQSYMS